jgi:predicted PurR-regulated permease PerM
MTFRQQVLFWCAGFLVVILTIYVLSSILLPFVAGMILAYMLDPLADRLERAGVSRLIATCVILVLFTALFVACIVVLAPLVGSQLLAFAERFPAYLQNLVKLFNAWSPDWLKSHIDKAMPGIQAGLSGFTGKAALWLAGFAKSIWSGSLALISFLSLFFVTPVVAFYMLYDWDRMVSTIDNWLPRDHADAIRAVSGDINTTMAGFLRGQGLVCLILAVFYAVGLSLIGLENGLLIGLGAGFLSFVPYIGSILGLVISGLVAVFQFWPEWPMVAATLAVFIAGQMLEGNVLSPKLVGGSVGLHPVWLMFALFAFGLLFGFVGLLIAVPAAAAIGVVVRFFLARYLESPLYLGKDGASGRSKPKQTRKRSGSR